MKLAILSDMHIGYERFAEDAYNQAEAAVKAAMSVADMLLIPGDVFDKRAPKPDVIAQGINIFREASKHKWPAKVVEFNAEDGTKPHTEVPIIAIPGTHERTAEGRENVLSLLALAGLIVDASEATVIVAKHDRPEDKVAVFGLGGVSEDRVKECLERLKPKPVSGAFNVFMFHQSTYELLPFDDELIRYVDLPKGFDLYVDGHIHNKVEATVHGKPFLIPGSTVLTQLKDGEQEKKGFFLFDTEDSSYEFIHIDSRTFVCKEMKFDSAKPGEVLKLCDDEIGSIIASAGNGHKPIIRIKLVGSLGEGVTSADVPIRVLTGKYSSLAYLEIDSSRLVSPDVVKGMEEVREGRLGDVPVKELGMRMFASRLRENKFEIGVDGTKLFEALSGDKSKEKAMKEAQELLDGAEEK